MTKLELLIEQLCPDGVTYSMLDEITSSINIGINPRKFFKLNPDHAECFYVTVRELDGLNGVHQYAKTDRIDMDAVKIINNRAHIDRGDILFSNTGTVGKLALVLDKPKNWGVNEGIYVIKPINSIVNSRYLYYYLSSNMANNEYTKKFTGSTLKHVTQKALSQLRVPIPPLEVQIEIIRILDTFTELTAELTTELANRKKQYEYYRDNLLSFATSIPVKRIGEITKVFSAARVHKGDWTTEGVPFFRSSDVISAFNGEANPRGKAFISYDLYERLSQKSGRFEKDDILITGGGTIGIPYIIPTDDPLYVKDADLICVKKNDFVRSRFLYHYFLSNDFRKYLKNITHDATIAHYTITQIENTPIPVPSLSTQDRLINVLDNFEAICSDLNSGLPAEIEARQKQYEYYRDKLLTFTMKE